MFLRQRLTPVLAIIACFGCGQVAMAQGQFSPVITVNESAISQFELSQRRKILELFRTPGDLDKQAREGLIDDRLKQIELDRVGISLSEESLNAAMEEFAGRANLTLPQFTQILAQNGVELATLRDFVRIGVSWRDYIRSRFNRDVTITDADVAGAIARSGNSTTDIEVLMSEIIIPAPPNRAAQAQATAERISQIRSFDRFAAAARQFSALPSKARGGRMDWLPVSNYPPQLQGLLLGLSPGEVTAPISIPNGVALFQMRDIREVAQAPSPPASIDYAAYYIPGGRSEAGLRIAAQTAGNIDTCDDLYGIARNQPAENLDRFDSAPNEIPNDVALELARLDRNEVSYNLTKDNGQTLVFLMLCSRNVAGQGDIDPDNVRNQIRSQRLAGLADALLSDLRAAAVIRE